MRWYRFALPLLLGLFLLIGPALAQKGVVRFAYYKPGWGVNGIIHADDLLGKQGWKATYLPYAGSPAALITSFGAGQIDATDMSLWLAAKMYERGIPLRVVGTVQSMQGAIIVPARSPILSAEQLVGKKVAAIVASTAYHDMRHLIKLAYKIDLERQNRVISTTSPPDAVNLLERGEVDAILLWSPPNEQLVSTGRYRYLVKAIDLWRKATGRREGFPVYVVFIVNSKFLKVHPDFPADLNRVQRRAADTFYNDKERAVRIISRTIGLDRKVVEFTYRQTVRVLHGLTEEQIGIMLQQLRMAKESGYLNSEVWLRPAEVRRLFCWR